MPTEHHMQNADALPPPTLPDDVKAMLDHLRRTRSKDTVIQFMGGELRLGDALNELAPMKEERTAIDRHVDRWARFQRRWSGHPIMGVYATDMRVWEARKAGVALTVNDPAFGIVDLKADRMWFYGLDPQLRLSLVQDEIGRKVSERRLKLARKKLRELSLPKHHIDAITSLKTA